MRFKIKLYTVLFAIIVILVSCNKEKEQTEVTGREIFDFGNHAESIIVNKYADYEIVEYCYKGKDTNEVIEWFYGLQLEVVEKIADDSDGNEVYEVTVDDEKAFIYDYAAVDGPYIIIDKKRYKVRNYSLPSFENAEKKVIWSYDMEEKK